MVVELDFNEFYFVRFLFKNFEKFILGVTSVFEGNSTGVIFVNKKKNPTSAIMYFGISSIIITGDKDDDSFISSLSSFFREILFPRIKENSKSKTFSIYFEPP